MDNDTQSDPKTTELGITFSEKSSPREDEDKKGSGPTSPNILMRESELMQRKGVFDVAKAFEAEHEAGTIVTDRRKRRSSLGENVVSAFSEWWGGVKEASVPALKALTEDEEVETVEKVEKRANVVESAAQDAHLAPKDDHRVVIEKIQTYGRDVARITGMPYTVKEAKKDAPGWTHVVETSNPSPSPVRVPEQKKAEPVKQPLPVKTPPRPSTPPPPPDLRAHLVAPVVEKRIKKDIDEFSPKPTPVKSRTEAPKAMVKPAPFQSPFTALPDTVVRKPDVVVKPKVTEVAPVVTERVTGTSDDLAREVPRSTTVWKSTLRDEPVKPTLEALRSELRSLEEKEKDPSLEPPIPVPETVFHTSEGEVVEKPEVPQKKLSASSSSSTPSFSFGVPVLVGAVFGVVVAVVASISGNLLRNEPVVSEQPEAGRETPIAERTRALVSLKETVDIPFDGSRETFFLDIQSKLLEQTEETRYYPRASFDTDGVLTAEEFFTALNTTLPGRAVRSLENDFTIGAVVTDVPEPFLMVRTRNFDTLFAGMLAWEETMTADLGTLFDIQEETGLFWSDAVKNNKSVRVLEAEDGTPLLMYAFVDSHTVVITSSLEALSLIIGKI